MQKIISDLYKNNWGKHGKSEKIYIKKTNNKKKIKNII